MTSPSHSSKHLLAYTKRVIMSRHKRILLRKNQLQKEITELKRQLKQHPLGTIILNEKIKQKRIAIKNLNAKKLIAHYYPRKRKSRISYEMP